MNHRPRPPLGSPPPFSSPLALRCDEVNGCSQESYGNVIVDQHPPIKSCSKPVSKLASLVPNNQIRTMELLRSAQYSHRLTCTVSRGNPNKAPTPRARACTQCSCPPSSPGLRLVTRLVLWCKTKRTCLKLKGGSVLKLQNYKIGFSHQKTMNTSMSLTVLYDIIYVDFFRQQHPV